IRSEATAAISSRKALRHACRRASCSVSSGREHLNLQPHGPEAAGSNSPKAPKPTSFKRFYATARRFASACGRLLPLAKTGGLSAVSQGGAEDARKVPRCEKQDVGSRRTGLHRPA